LSEVPNITLHDGVEIPQLGFGVFQIPPADTKQAVEQALEIGYRHIDTAAAYRNEKGVGEAIKTSGIPRDEVFVTTKLWNSQQGYDSTLEAFEGSLGRLDLDHVDLYLIHWPVPTEGRFVDTWRAFEKIHADGGARTIGVSNFRIEDLERLEEETETRPTVNQIECHPWLQQDELRAWQEEHEIVTEAWSPLAQGGEFLEDETLTAIAAELDRTPAQVILRWHLQLGNVVFPKSAHAERMRENFALFDFALTDEQMDRIAALDRDERTGPEPAVFAAP
jgi:diketogulonate reductase-like aldo/keto reductase